MLEENKIPKTRVILIPFKKKKPYNVFMGISPVVQLAKTLCSQCRGLGSITCQGTIPYASTRKKILHAAIKEDPACCSKKTLCSQ